jgi:hypothetical protein
MSYFDQWSGTAGNVADSYGLDRSVFFGLIDTESSWNPNADAPGSSAYGFTQLLSGTANSLGVNRFDPVQNLNGGAKYLSSMINRFGLTKGLAAYHDGPGAIGLHGGYEYARTVLDKAKKYLGTGSSLLNNGAVQAGLNAALPGSGAVAGIFGNMLGGGDSCGLNPICYLQQWIDSSKFFQRLGLAILAFIVLAAAFYLMNRPEINETISKAALAA